MTDLAKVLHHVSAMHKRMVEVEFRQRRAERLLRWVAAAAAAAAAGHGIPWVL